MFKTILVPTDGSNSSKAALDYAIGFASAYDAVICGLYVIDVRNLEGPFLTDIVASVGVTPFADYQNKIYAILEQRARSILDELADRCRDKNVKVEIRIEQGIVSKTICEQASLSDVVIMGGLGEHSMFNDVFIGSTTEGVIRKTNKPVIIVPENVDFGPSVIGRIVVAYDGSEQANDALGVAVNIASENKSSLDLLLVGDKLSDIKNKAEKYIKAYEIEYSIIEKQGKAYAEILEHAEKNKCDLIVMGSYEHSKLYNFVLGSTEQVVLQEAVCPVLVVR